MQRRSVADRARQSDESGGVFRRRKSDRGFHEVQFSLNVGHALELHIQGHLLRLDQPELLLNEIALLTDFRLKHSKCAGPSGLTPLASVDWKPGMG